MAKAEQCGHSEMGDDDKHPRLASRSIAILPEQQGEAAQRLSTGLG